MHLRVLGCSGGFGAGLRTTAFLVDDDVLIDAGTGVGDLPYEQLRRIRHIFVTHSHLDHIASIPLLVDTLFDELSEPLVVHAQQQTIDALREHLFNGQIWPDFSALPDPDRAVLHFEPLEPGSRRTLAGRTFESIPVEHTVPAVAYRCSDASGAFCFSGDTSTNETLWPALNAASALDLLIVEAAFPNSEQRLARIAQHYCPASLAVDLAKLNAWPRLAVTHLKSGHEDEIMAELEATLPEHEVHRLQAGDSFQL